MKAILESPTEGSKLLRVVVQKNEWIPLDENTYINRDGEIILDQEISIK
ncbi:MAG: hypothetical protein ACRCST_01305 [Turicibacter sp.]